MNLTKKYLLDETKLPQLLEAARHAFRNDPQKTMNEIRAFGETMNHEKVWVDFLANLAETLLMDLPDAMERAIAKDLQDLGGKCTSI